jgi:hypothetical protein
MSNNGGYLGRFSVIDGKTRRIASSPIETRWYAGDSALRTHIASFHGNHFVAERDGQDLHVHMLHDENGRPALENPLHHQEGTSGLRSSAGSGLDAIGGVSSLTELNAMNSKHWAGIGVRRRA